MNGFKKLLTLVLSLFCFTAVFSQEEEPSSDTTLMLDTELVDIPTAGAIDYYGMQIETRFFSQGGVMTYLTFGVLPRLNLGASATIEKLIGSGEPIRLVRPEIQVKFRFYDGSLFIPAFAIGYDGQGHYYNPATDIYSEQRRGLYLVASHEVILPNLFLHPGINVSDFESEDIYGFVAANFTIEDVVGLMAEWDHLQDLDDSRVNVGLRFYVTPFFHFDFSVRAINKDDDDKFEDGTRHRTERIAVLRYHTTF